MTNNQEQVSLALRPREAAKALSISERLLWSLSAPRGPILCKRIGGRGGCVLYAVDDLRRWLAEQSQASKGADHDEC